MFSCMQVRSSVNPPPQRGGTEGWYPTKGTQYQGQLDWDPGALYLSTYTGCPGLHKACPALRISPLELFFLRIEARTRSEPRWAWWCRWARASWNQSPVRIFSCLGSASEARSLLEDWGGGGWGRGDGCYHSPSQHSCHPLCARPSTWGQGHNSKSDLIPALEELGLVGRLSPE